MSEADTSATTGLPGTLDQALRRLNEAVVRLRASAERRASAQAARNDRDDAFMLMHEDRTRLAMDLDTALAESERMRVAHLAAIERLDRAESSVQIILRSLGEADAASSAGETS